MTDPNAFTLEQGAPHLRRAVHGAESEGDAGTTTADELELACFTIHEQLYAIATRSVSAILAAVPLTELPGAPSCVAGVVAHQGRVVAVVDVAVLDGRPPVASPKRILVVEAGGIEAGVRVSSVTEIAAVSSAAVSTVSASLSPPDHVIGQVLRHEAPCFVIDVARLLDRVQRRVAESEAAR